jgi:hypothetical protein
MFIKQLCHKQGYTTFEAPNFFQAKATFPFSHIIKHQVITTNKLNAQAADVINIVIDWNILDFVID